MFRFAKTATYALMHLTVAIAVAYAISGSWAIALSIGIVEPLVQTVAYSFHEKAWDAFLARRAQSGLAGFAAPPRDGAPA